MSCEKARQIQTVLALITLALASLVACSSNPAPEARSSATPTTGSIPLAPEARFAATPTTGYVPLGVQFIDRSIGNIDTWQWDFNNDGTVDSTIRNPWYTYKNVGNYTVSLTVSGPDGSNTDVMTAFIEVMPHPGLANFIAEPTYGDGPTTVQFTDMSTGNVTGWAWDFGDNTTSTEQNPTHTYTEKRKYSVTLTVTANGITDTVTKPDYINLSGCPS